MKNNAFLLIILAVLFLAKFIVQPIIEWQNTTLAESSRLQQKLDKAQAYITELPKLEGQKVALIQKIKESKQRVDTYNDFDRYQIAKQRQVEMLFTQHNVSTKSLNWQDTVTTPLGKTAKLQVQFNGLLKDFIALQLDLMSQSTSIELSVFGLQLREGAEGSLGDVTGNILLTFRPLEAENVAV